MKIDTKHNKNIETSKSSCTCKHQCAQVGGKDVGRIPKAANCHTWQFRCAGQGKCKSILGAAESIGSVFGQVSCMFYYMKYHCFHERCFQTAKHLARSLQKFLFICIYGERDTHTYTYKNASVCQQHFAPTAKQRL